MTGMPKLCQVCLALHRKGKDCRGRHHIQRRLKVSERGQAGRVRGWEVQQQVFMEDEACFLRLEKGQTTGYFGDIH